VSYAATLPWTLEKLDLSRIDVEKVRHNEDLFMLLCSSSFVESGSDLYTHNLVDHFAGDDELQAWLRDHWEHEEMQHGRALAAYVRHVWPEFDWETGFRNFFAHYGSVCTADELEPNRGLELAARCVVETGTASLYRALNEVTDEPVLRELTNYIKSDEVRHYKHFYQHFRIYRARDKIGRLSTLRTLMKRLNEIKNEDSDIALRHVFNTRYPEKAHDDAEFRRVTGKAENLLKRHLPAEMTVKMLLRPLDLPAKINTMLEWPLTRITEKLFLH
jgi:ferritin